MLKHLHLTPLFPTFNYLLSDHMIKNQFFELNLFSCWLCLAEKAVVSSFCYPSEGDFVSQNHLILHRNLEVSKCPQETSDQLFKICY